jgi:hypothetical protein
LWLDGLSGQNAADRCEQQVPVEQFDISSQLLNRVQAGDPLDLNGPVPSGGLP